MATLRKYAISLVGLSPYSQGRDVTDLIKSPPDGDTKEPLDAADARVCRDRMHYNEKGNVFIPPMAIKNALAEVAKYLSMSVPGKGKATYTKHFEAGVLCFDATEISYNGKPVTRDDVVIEKLFVPADGKRGSGRRVHRRFPHVPAGWRATVTVAVADATITEEVLLHHIKEAGNFIGIGRFRLRNNGFYGRFEVQSLKRVS
jgi:hypothetical protein